MVGYKDIYLPNVIGAGYKAFWNCKQRYRVVKGGRGSKKSTTMSLWIPYNMMKFFHEYGLMPNTLVIREYFNTHRDSTYAQLKWSINRLGVAHLWSVTKSPLELTYKPSGQKILFRGMDDPDSITSITVHNGYLCWVWWEEVYQIKSEEAFNKVDMSIRGDMPAPLFKQHTLTFNPWSDKIWIKSRFFDKPDPDVFTATKNFDCNEFLGDDDRAIFEKMRIHSPRRYNIEGLGNWGIAEGLIYDNWKREEFDIAYMRNATDRYGKKLYKEYFGLDYGYTNDPTAFIAVMIDERNMKLYIFDEIYRTMMKNRDIYNTIRYKGYDKNEITADSEDPRTTAELRDMGLNRIKKAKKGQGSVNAGIQKLQDYTIIVHPICENTLVEFENYSWDKDKETGKYINTPIGEFDHLMDALRYATEDLLRPTFSFH